MSLNEVTMASIALANIAVTIVSAIAGAAIVAGTLALLRWTKLP